MLRKWADRSEMPISSIPCDPEPDRILPGMRFATPLSPARIKRLDGEVRWVHYRSRGVITPRMVHDFDMIIIGTENLATLVDHPYLQDVAEMNPDTVFLDTVGIPVKRDLMMNLHARRSLMEMMLRNTLPLITVARNRVGSPTRSLRNSCLTVSAVETQILLRFRDKGLSDNEQEKWFRSLRALQFAGLIDADTDHSMSYYRGLKNPRISQIGEDFLRSLPSSAYDPGFVDRWETWNTDPEPHKEQYRLWIRTWSGRLRRHQAKTWKVSIPKAALDVVSERIDKLVSIEWEFSRNEQAKILAEKHPEMGKEDFFAAIISHKMNEIISLGRYHSMNNAGNIEYDVPENGFF